jgi:hypothetical protein
MIDVEESKNHLDASGLNSPAILETLRTQSLDPPSALSTLILRKFEPIM